MFPYQRNFQGEIGKQQGKEGCLLSFHTQREVNEKQFISLLSELSISL